MAATRLYITDLPKFKTLKAISTKSIATGALDWSIEQVSCTAGTRQIRHHSVTDCSIIC